MDTNALPLGKKTEYKNTYDASLLFPISREKNRDEIGITSPLPFSGVDIWNAYELSWLNLLGRPEIAIATFYFPANSPHIIESKSFKLYLGSFSQTKIDSVQSLKKTIETDLTKVSGVRVNIAIKQVNQFKEEKVAELNGVLLDELDLNFDEYVPNINFLNLVEKNDGKMVEETLVSHLLRSNCPVTNQPDWASIQIYYEGTRIDHKGLLRYIVSYRTHTGFHEQCVEKIFIDILEKCKPSKLSVYARYTRRGGLDINPFRSNFDAEIPKNIRIARQ